MNATDHPCAACGADVGQPCADVPHVKLGDDPPPPVTRTEVHITRIRWDQKA